MRVQDMMNLEDGTYDLGNQRIRLASPETGYWVAEKPISVYDVVNLANNAIAGYLGVWTDPETGEKCIDLTRWVESLDNALELGQKWNQKAIWDISAHLEVPLV